MGTGEVHSAYVFRCPCCRRHNAGGSAMSYGKCWVCGTVMSGDSQTIEGKVKCDRCGWNSHKDGSY